MQIFPNPDKHENIGIALFKVTPTEADFHVYYSTIISDKIHTKRIKYHLFCIVFTYFIVIIFQLLNLKNYFISLVLRVTSIEWMMSVFF